MYYLRVGSDLAHLGERKASSDEFRGRERSPPDGSGQHPLFGSDYSMRYPV